ncbi:aspartate kinase [Helicobacter winghamensis]|uniref:Aspartokinase n=1 Tax=Helicobacter winghamensis TaxID=157268 RepID=A0A2N3PJE0_9HELI|nr:aspartate kinase [Helicobacter winghamensis]EEO25350.1 aspartate kinase, monofunctional class [Helicobacter winghamensis ATCC BAA-430]PKT78210.1 aspartate kinase [Helicobacter winghamensis]PKT78479.1 aspartate kinase [Helicobacter winghamensis]PKT78739.1 aspartate kinase [Helicobacter winghamensis]PKT80510.1 aspartate kinase [Helicobacter winghamensis]
MLIVQKYGGTSVGDCERIQNVAKRVIEAKRAGNSVVVVVSAMSGETDKLLGYTQFFSRLPNTREVDMVLSAGERVTSALLAIALEELGYKAISLSGRGAGMITDSSHTKARIESIDTMRLNDLLAKDYIVVVAGFQGVTQQGDVTTLGRGGSDLSAVALAGALQADLCEIYTDVDGVYTTDPRIEPKAKKINKISYDEMLELASMGAKVLLNRSVEMAKKLNVNLVTRNSFNHNEGTLITKEEEIMEHPIVSGIALDKNQARVSICNVEDRPGIAAEIFGALSEANINVDMIVQTIGRDGKTDVDFTIPEVELENTKRVLKAFESNVESIDYDSDIAKVSIVGVGMKSHSGVAAKAFQALAEDNINIMMISTSEIKISMIIGLKYSELAIRTLHSVYALDK